MWNKFDIKFEIPSKHVSTNFEQMLKNASTDTRVISLRVSRARTGNIDDFIQTILNDMCTIFRCETLFEQSSRRKLQLLVLVHAAFHDDI